MCVRYARAEDLDHHLHQMEASLRKIVGDYNAARGGGGGGGTGVGGLDGDDGAVGAAAAPAAKIVAVLNSHHDTLALLDAKSRQLQQELLVISRDIRMAPALY
jgi:hypothetical protein